MLYHSVCVVIGSEEDLWNRPERSELFKEGTGDTGIPNTANFPAELLLTVTAMW